MRIGRSTVVHFGSQVVVTLSGFVATLYIARALGSEVLGYYATTVALLFWFTIPVNAIGTAMTKRISEGVDTGEFLAAGALLVVAVLAGEAVLSLLFRQYIDAYVGVSVGGLFAFLLIGQGAVKVVLPSLKGQKEVGMAGVVKAIDRLLRTAFQVGLVVLGYGIGGLLVGHAAAFFLATVLALRFLDVWPSRPRWEHFRSLYEYARFSWLGTLKTRTFAWMDTIVLAFFVAPGLIGVYEVAWTLASTLALASLSVRQVLFPEMSELSIDDDSDRIHRYLEEGLLFSGFFLLPGLAGAAIVGPRILRVYSPEFQQGSTILLILIGARIVAAFGGQFVNVVNAIDRPDVAFRINAAFVVVNVVLNVLLVWRVGWYGAAIATATSALLIAALGYGAVASLIGRPSVPVVDIGKQIAAGMGMALFLLPLVRWAPTGNGITIGLVLLGASFYSVALLAFSSRIRGRAIDVLGMW